MAAELPISAREAPADFSGGLPTRPPSKNEIRQLLELWSNVTRINSLRIEQWGETQRSEYMLWTTDDSRQFRVMWDDDKERFETQERTAPL